MNVIYSLKALIVIEIVTLVLFYSSFIMGTASFYFADATFWLQPMAQYLYESVRQGRFPLWNPLCYCGMPQLAITFPNLLYPPDLLFILFPFNTALGLSMVFHQTLAAVGMYLLVRGMREPPPSAMVAALIYSLSGYMFALPSNHSLVAGAAWFVFAFWTIRHLEFVPFQKLPLQTLYGALSICMLFASGRPEIFVPSYLLIAAYVVRNFVRRKPNTNNCLFWQIRVLFLGVCFALPTLLPTFEWLSMSRRALGLQTFEVFLYSANWYDLVSMIIGQVLGDLRLHGAQFKPLLSPLNMPPYLSCAFVGSVAITLAIWGLSTRLWRIKWALMIVLLMTLIVSMGNNTIVMSVLVNAVPALGFVRYPVKMLFVPVFVLSILAARGMSSLLFREVANKFAFWIWCLVLAFAAIWIIAAERGVGLAQFDGFGRTALAAVEAQKRIGVGLSIAAMVGLVVTGGGFSVKRGLLKPGIASIATILVLTCSLIAHAVLFERLSANSDYFQQPSFAAEQIAKFRKRGINSNSRVLNLCLEKLTIPDSYLIGSQKERSIAMYQYDREVVIPNTHMNFGLASSHGFEGTMRGDYVHTLLYAYFQSTQTLNPSIISPSDVALALFSKITDTGFIITQVERRLRSGELMNVNQLDPRFFNLLLQDRRRNIRIYQVNQLLPRIYLSHDWKIATHNQVIEGILNPEAKNFNPKTLTWLEDCSIVAPGATGQGHPRDTVKILKSGPESLSISCESTEASMLVIEDQPYPGWFAKIDGKPTSIFTANAFNRAVFVPPGMHKVTFEYYSNSFALGVSLACLSVFLLLYLFWTHDRERVLS